MQALPVKEQAFVHALKALTQGEVSGAEDRASSVAESETIRSAAQSRDAVPEKVPTPYTDPEDLEFGKSVPKTVRKNPIYAVVWTGGHRRCRTKDGKKDRHSAARTIKAWLRWKERQGWTIAGSQASGWYIATKEGDRQAISLREYDRETLERL